MEFYAAIKGYALREEIYTHTTLDISSLMVPEARNLKSRCWQSNASFRLLGKSLLLPLSSWWLQIIFLVRKQKDFTRCTAFNPSI